MVKFSASSLEIFKDASETNAISNRTSAILETIIQFRLYLMPECFFLQRLTKSLIPKVIMKIADRFRITPSMKH